MSFKNRRMYRSAYLSSLLLTPWLSSCGEDQSFVANSQFAKDVADQDATANKLPNAGDAEAIMSDGEKKDTAGNFGSDNAAAKTPKTLEKVFVAGLGDSQSFALTWNGDQVSAEVQLDATRTAAKRSYTQNTRPQLTELMSQGSAQQDMTQSFMQNSAGGAGQGVLDIVLVMDNSGSMAQEQANLAGKLAPLLEYVKDSDWRIGVVTTDPNDGCLRGLVTKQDPDANTAFATAVSPGVSGSSNERGILQAVNALKGGCNPTGSWLRPNSTVAVLIVSDEDNCSLNGSDCKTQDYRSSDYLIDYLSTIRAPGSSARVYGLIRHASQSLAECSTAANPGIVYSDAITRTGGTWGSICSTDFTPTLMAISQNISVILRNQFALKFAPQGTTLKVYLDGVLQSSGYEVQGNVVTFVPAPAPGTQITFAYSYFTEPPKTAFVLNQAADPATLALSMDGVAVSKALYSYNATTRTITFITAPLGQQLKAVFQPIAGLLQSFEIPTAFDPASVKATVNGNAETGIRLAADKKSISFDRAPADGALVELSFQQIGAPILSYPIFAPGAPSAVIVDSTGKIVAGAKITDNRLEIQASDYTFGRKVLIKFGSAPGIAAKPWVVAISALIIPSTLKVQSATMSCPMAKLIISASTLDASQCGFKTGEKVTVAFAYAKANSSTFVIDDAEVKGIADKLKWTVKVNGVSCTEFEHKGTNLDIPNLPAGSTVAVTLEFPADA